MVVEKNCEDEIIKNQDMQTDDWKGATDGKASIDHNQQGKTVNDDNAHRDSMVVRLSRFCVGSDW